METKHTPGPWRVSSPSAKNAAGEDMTDLICSGTNTSYTGDVARLDWRGGNAAELSANARLVAAAAPDLLGALESMMWIANKYCSHGGELCGKYNDEELAKARAAIAHATGDA